MSIERSEFSYCISKAVASNSAFLSPSPSFKALRISSAVSPSAPRYATVRHVCMEAGENTTFRSTLLSTTTSQRNNDTNFVFSPFAMQSFEDLVKLGFSDKPELPDDNFSEIMEGLKDSEAYNNNNNK
uniref:Uncharacterized protein n=1 Tax=Glossina pallidipes TaxID=7398 RepID=A0A1B0AB04_GLOPL